MEILTRRSFLRNVTAAGVGSSIAPATGLDWLYADTTGQRFSAFDKRKLPGNTFEASRVAMGTGVKGRSYYKRNGPKKLIELIRHGTERGLNFWDTADAYGSHPVYREVLKYEDRDKVAILTKSKSRTAEGMKADIERFRMELNTDYLDIVLMHVVTDPKWQTAYAGARDVLADARDKGLIRAIGLSMHDFATMKTAVDDDWTQFMLARINHKGVKMDATPDEVAQVLKRGHENGKFIMGMKIVGEGALRDEVEPSLKFVLGQGFVHNFTIGFENIAEMDDMIEKIAATRV